MASLLWRPQIPLSIDGEPLAISVSHLIDLTSFPYDRLTTNAFIAFFLKPLTPVILIFAYLITESVVLPRVCRSLGVTGKTTLWKIIFSLHNFGLAVFSFIVWVNSWVSV